MIQVTKGAAPLVLESENCRNRVELNILNQEFKGAYYNSAPVLGVLENAFHNKCCFCETYIRPVDTPQVEHYRPKNKLKDEPSHTGYYWLGHEWPNLLLACPACNKAKSSLCYVEGPRVSTPNLLPDGKLDRTCCNPNTPPLSDEKPLLINPEYEDPEVFFRFKPDGSITSTRIRGIKSIEICKLDRPDLGVARKRVLDEYIRELNEYFAGYTEGILTDTGLEWFVRSLANRIKSDGVPQKDFTLFRKQCFMYFEDFFVQQFDVTRKNLVRKIFQEIH